MAGLIATYLHDLGHSLYVSSRLKARILCEIEDHLYESVQHNQERGLPIEEAEQQAIANFGSPSVVAQQFATDLAAESAGTGSRVLLPTVICLQLVTQFGYHFLPFGDRPRNVITDDFLAWMINLYSYAFLAAVAACIYAFWRGYRYRWGAPMPLGEIQHVVGVLALALAALAVAGVTTGVFVFRLPGSPPLLVQVGIAGGGMLLVLIGGIFVRQAIARYVALQATRRHSEARATPGTSTLHLQSPPTIQ